MRLIYYSPHVFVNHIMTNYLCQLLNIPYISYGDTLRASISEGTQLGHSLKKAIDAGEVLTADSVTAIIKERIEQADCINGFLLDNFPNNILQAEAFLAAHISIDFVMEVKVREDELIERLPRLLLDLWLPPRSDTLINMWMIRDRDPVETIRKCMHRYHEQQPAIDFYKTLAATDVIGVPRYVEIDGMVSKEEVFAKLQSALGR